MRVHMNENFGSNRTKKTKVRVTNIKKKKKKKEVSSPEGFMVTPDTRVRFLWTEFTRSRDRMELKLGT